MASTTMTTYEVPETARTNFEAFDAWLSSLPRAETFRPRDGGLTNDKMRQNRFYNWSEARRKARTIHQHLNAGGTVVISTALRATKLSRKHVGMIEARKSGLYMQNGRSWVNCDYCAIQYYV